MTTTATINPAADNSAILQSYIQKQEAAKKAETSTSKTDSSKSLAGDFNTFLKILTTQLENQDPLNAQDTNAFTQQLVQFASVEQQINANDKLDKLVSLSQAEGVTSLLGYVGKYVESGAGGFMLVQDGTGKLAYDIKDSFTSVTFNVKNDKGIQVASFTGPFTLGEKTVTWDGKLANGSQIADGTYQITATGTKADGTKIDLKDSIRMIGKVESIVSNTDGTATLGLGDLALKETGVLKVYDKYGT